MTGGMKCLARKATWGHGALSLKCLHACALPSPTQGMLDAY